MVNIYKLKKTINISNNKIKQNNKYYRKQALIYLDVNKYSQIFQSYIRLLNDLDTSAKSH